MNKGRFVIILLLSILLSLTVASASADSLSFPLSLLTIEDEAFYGDTSVDNVVLPDGIKTIGKRAFADSSISSIFLPASIDFIEDSAFYNTSVVGIGQPGTYAQEWFESHGLVYQVPSTSAECFEWEIINGIEARITKYKGNDSFVYIPAMIDDKT